MISFTIAFRRFLFSEPQWHPPPPPPFPFILLQDICTLFFPVNIACLHRNFPYKRNPFAPRFTFRPPNPPRAEPRMPPAWTVATPTRPTIHSCSRSKVSHNVAIRNRPPLLATQISNNVRCHVNDYPSGSLPSTSFTGLASLLIADCCMIPIPFSCKQHNITMLTSERVMLNIYITVMHAACTFLLQRKGL